MSKINAKIMKIGNSSSRDVVGYRVRVAPEGTPVDYDFRYTETADTTMDVATLPLMADVEGTFDFYVSAVDTAGNESDFAVAKGVLVDFLAPNPPSGITF